MEKQIAVAGHDGSKDGTVVILFQFADLFFDRFFQHLRVAEAQMDPLFGIDFALAVGLESEKFRLVTELFVPVSERVIGNGTAHRAAETAAAVPDTDIAGSKIGIVGDLIKECACVVRRTGTHMKTVYGNLLFYRSVCSQFAGPEPADSQNSFDKFVGGVKSSHGDGAPGKKSFPVDPLCVAAGKEYPLSGAQDGKVLRRKHRGGNAIFPGKFRFPHINGFSPFEARFTDHRDRCPCHQFEVALQLFCGVFVKDTFFVGDHHGKKSFPTFDQFKRSAHLCRFNSSAGRFHRGKYI